jgi:UDP-glucose 4-epimerase
MKKLKLLVTGGAGYIGSHMCKMLGEHGHAVTVLDNLSRGHEDAVLGMPLLRCDLTDASSVDRALRTESFDAVLHFAALAYVGESVVEPAAYYRTNVVGTLNLLDAMRQAGVRKLVFSSTCATYGTPDLIPIAETAPQRPINPYGHSKWMVEQMLRDHSTAYGLNSISLRYFNAAGCDASGVLGERHQPETHLIPLVLTEALRVLRGGAPGDSRLRVFGADFPTPDGSCIRDYVHVNDLCVAHLLAIERLQGSAGRGAEAFNLGNGSGFSVFEVIAACTEVTGVKIGYQVAPRRAGDPAELVGNAELAARVLEWHPQLCSLESIVASTWHWMKSRPTAEFLS